MDHHATTPLDAEVLEAMMPFLTEHFGNPSSSTHEFGRVARNAVELGRQQIADLIGAESADEIIFTSGATESDNLALKGAAYARKGKTGHIITLAIEHKAVLDAAKRLQKEGYEIGFAKLDSYGVVNLDDIRNLIKPETFLISVQTANSDRTSSEARAICDADGGWSPLNIAVAPAARPATERSVSGSIATRITR